MRALFALSTARSRRQLALATLALGLVVGLALFVLTAAHAAPHKSRHPLRHARHTSSARKHKPKVLRVGTYKGKHGQFSSIHEALAAAHPGDWILIGPGDYKQSSSTNAPGASGDD